MEFKLNKIDTDIRKKMQEEIRDDKVNKNNSTNTKKDMEQKIDKNSYSYNKKKTKKKKSSFQVDCIKYTDKELEIQGEKIQITNEENQKGQRIDIKK